MSQRQEGRAYAYKWERTGGSVLEGESSFEGALREVHEELGVDLSESEHCFIKTQKRERYHDFFDAWLFIVDREQIKCRIDPNEVRKCKWVTLEELTSLKADNKLVPSSDYYNEVYSVFQKKIIEIKKYEILNTERKINIKNIDKLTEQFKSLYKRFLIGCDSIEEIGQWNKEELGEMDVFYQNDLVSVILMLIATDGEISDKEVEYLNKNFGFDYSVDELSDVYEGCKEEIDSYFDENFKNGISYMRTINAKLADAYKELLGLICDIIVESDNIVSDDETKIINQLKEKL